MPDKHRNGADQVLVDRVVMIHVELHHRDDLAEFRNEAAQKAGLVHPPQNDRRLPGGQDRQEQPVGLLVGAQFGIDQPQRTGDALECIGMELQSRMSARWNTRMMLTGSRLKTSASARLMRFVLEKVGSVPGILRGRLAKRLHNAGQAGSLLGLLVLEPGADDPGEIADILGDQEIVLHEAFDRRQAGMILVAKARGDVALDIEGQPLLRLAGEESACGSARPKGNPRP
jgi:hypothetical protein